MTARVAEIWRDRPEAQRLEHPGGVDLAPGRAMPFDLCRAVAHERSRSDCGHAGTLD